MEQQRHQTGEAVNDSYSPSAIYFYFRIFPDYISMIIGNDHLELMDMFVIYAFNIIHHAGTFLSIKDFFPKQVIYIKEDLIIFFHRSYRIHAKL
jgi:hypothetical protein